MKTETIEVRAVSIYVPDALHHYAKIKAVTEKTTMEEALNDLLKKGIEADKK